jgi:hypothetical protein
LLPGATREIYLPVRVLWITDSGRAGCECAQVPPIDLTILHDWLKRKIHIKKPLITI